MWSLLSSSSSSVVVAVATLSVVALSSSSSLLLVRAHDDVVQLHGSGTTNPSKCYWKLMDQMMARSKVPLRMTYRAVGSSTGIFEFVGVNHTADFAYKAYNDFGSGDIPVPSDDYEALRARGSEVVHFPFVLGAISLFHSIPGFSNDDDNGLNLTSCDIAKIFKREILYWDDDAIQKDNPNLKVPYKNYPIKVAHRRKGSSSTASFTEYLHLTCPEEWPAESVGSKITWNEDTMTCEGSGGMTNCIRDYEGTIGYIDSGHGHSENLVEIELRNLEGKFLNSKQAGDSGIKRAALEALDEGIVPSRSDADHGAVKLLNKPGANTWPMVAMTYVFVRRDLTTVIEHGEAQTLLKYFLRSLYDPDTIAQCAEYGFTPVPGRVRDIALEGIASLITENGAEEWTTEIDTAAGAGQSDFVFSVKRRSFDELRDAGADAEAAALRARVDELGTLLSSKTTNTNDDTADSNADVALALAAVSVALWALAILYGVARSAGCVGGGTKTM